MIQRQLPKQYRHTYTTSICRQVEVPTRWYQSKKTEKQYIDVVKTKNIEYKLQPQCFALHEQYMIDDKHKGKYAQIYMTFKNIKMIIIENEVKVYPIYEINRIIIK